VNLIRYLVNLSTEGLEPLALCIVEWAIEEAAEVQVAEATSLLFTDQYSVVSAFSITYQESLSRSQERYTHS
jgi:hypothetical protein